MRYDGDGLNCIMLHSFYGDCDVIPAVSQGQVVVYNSLVRQELHGTCHLISKVDLQPHSVRLRSKENSV